MRRPAAVIYRLPLNGCSSCGLGVVEQDDLERWQRGEFTWEDWAWCKANIRNFAALAIPFLGPGIAAYSVTVGFGRLKMHPNVPNVNPEGARTWPCLTTAAQAALNNLASQYEKKQGSLPPDVLPPLPDPFNPGTEDGSPASSDASQTKMILGAVALATLGYFVWRRSKKKRK